MKNRWVFFCFPLMVLLFLMVTGCASSAKLRDLSRKPSAEEAFSFKRSDQQMFLIPQINLQVHHMKLIEYTYASLNETPEKPAVRFIKEASKQGETFSRYIALVTFPDPKRKKENSDEGLTNFDVSLWVGDYVREEAEKQKIPKNAQIQAVLELDDVILYSK